MKDKATALDEIARAVRTGTDLRESWKRSLSIAGFSDTPTLANFNILDEVTFVRGQVSRVFQNEPPPAEMNFTYFGLYETVKVKHVLYVSGGVDADFNKALEDGKQDYFPETRRLDSHLLDEISKMGGDGVDPIAYLVPLAAAAVLAKGTVQQLGIKLPTFVGFDSGDFVLIAN